MGFKSFDAGQGKGSRNFKKFCGLVPVLQNPELLYQDFWENTTLIPGER